MSANSLCLAGATWGEGWRDGGMEGCMGEMDGGVGGGTGSGDHMLTIYYLLSNCRSPSIAPSLSLFISFKMAAHTHTHTHTHRHVVRPDSTQRFFKHTSCRCSPAAPPPKLHHLTTCDTNSRASLPRFNLQEILSPTLQTQIKNNNELQM